MSLHACTLSFYFKPLPPSELEVLNSASYLFFNYLKIGLSINQLFLPILFINYTDPITVIILTKET